MLKNFRYGGGSSRSGGSHPLYIGPSQQKLISRTCLQIGKRVYLMRVKFFRLIGCWIWGHEFPFSNKCGIGLCRNCDRLYYQKNGIAIERVNKNGRYDRKERRRVRAGMGVS